MMPLPEEVKAQLREQLDQHHMAIETFRHDVQRLFEEVHKEHLVTLRHLFNHFAQVGNQVYPAYLEGVTAATLHYRFGVCASCGEDHAEALLKQDGADSQGQPAVDGETVGQMNIDEIVHQTDEERYVDNCVKWGVTPVDTELPGPNARVKCNRCGQVYPNLADRMVKPPGLENCPGCVHKAKWG